MHRTLMCALALSLTGMLSLPPARAQFSGGLRDQARAEPGERDGFTKSIDALDAQIETHIAEVVTLLSSVRDSTGTSRSGTSRASRSAPC